MNAVCTYNNVYKDIVYFVLLPKFRHCRMASITRPLGWFNWFYHEFGLVSIKATGRNAYLIITARTMRMVSFGMTQVMLGKRLRVV
jgi:hypothetical protein